MPPNLYRVPQRNTQLRNRNRGFPYNLPFANDIMQSMNERLERTQEANYEILEELEDLHQRLRGSENAERRAKEQLRRQTEILTTTQKDLSDAQDGNQELLLRIKNLEPSMDSLSDDEAKDILGRLYHDLQSWLQRHFPRLPPRFPAQKKDGHNSPVDPTLEFFKIWNFVSETIYKFLLRKFMVGTVRGKPLDGELYQIDAHVNERCKPPARISQPHVAQHWRAATARAVSSLGASNIEDAYSDAISNVESEYGHNSPTLTSRRKEELGSLLKRFVDFKERLECQRDTYIFFWFPDNSPFDPNRMESFTGSCQRSAVIQYTLLPGLKKRQAGSGTIVLEKAIIKPVALPQPITVDDTDSSDEDTDEDKTDKRDIKRQGIKKEEIKEEYEIKKEPVVKKEHRMPGWYEADEERESNRERIHIKKEDDSEIEQSSASKMRFQVEKLSLQQKEFPWFI
ncbi:hypothetical protein N7528_006695 [Penicillium herquei]|nr:hypothetical protein N7528_006695 [Penicillium herquei]